MADANATGSVEPAPLSLSYLENQNDSFSAGIVRELKDSVFFRPRLNKKGVPTDESMLLLASSIIASADRHIRKIDTRNEQLENKLSLWNGPMFQNAVPAPSDAGADIGVDGSGTPPAEEIGWFGRHLTLRNVLGVFVVVSGVIWTYFVFYVGEKNNDSATLKATVTMQTARADQAQKESDEFRKKYEFNNTHNSEISTALTTEQTKNAELRKQLATAQSDTAKASALNVKLADALNKPPTKPALPPPQTTPSK